MTDQEKEQIINSILTETENNGSSRVGYHAEQILKIKPVLYHIKSKIEGSITANKRYKSRPHPNFKNDFEILINADYKKSTWEEKHPVLDRLRTGFITAIFSLIVGFTVYTFTVKKQVEKENIQNKSIEALSDSIIVLKKDIFELKKIRSVDTVIKARLDN